MAAAYITPYQRTGYISLRSAEGAESHTGVVKVYLAHASLKSTEDTEEASKNQ